MTKPITLYQYPFKVSPEIEEGDYKIRNKIYKHCGIGKKKERKKLSYFYGEFFIYKQREKNRTYHCCCIDNKSNQIRSH